MSSGATCAECLQRLLFGSPKGQLKLMQRSIEVPALGAAGAPQRGGTRLFLINFTAGVLHGPFVAAQVPALDIEREAWRVTGGGRTFPAQVRVAAIAGTRVRQLKVSRADVQRLRLGPISPQDTRALLRRMKVQG
jgi:hypothetical protein